MECCIFGFKSTQPTQVNTSNDICPQLWSMSLTGQVGIWGRLGHHPVHDPIYPEQDNIFFIAAISSTSAKYLEFRPPSPLSAFSVLFVRKIGIFLGPSPSMVQTYLMEAPVVSTICRRKGEVYALTHWKGPSAVCVDTPSEACADHVNVACTTECQLYDTSISRIHDRFNQSLHTSVSTFTGDGGGHRAEGRPTEDCATALGAARPGIKFNRK